MIYTYVATSVSINQCVSGWDQGCELRVTQFAAILFVEFNVDSFKTVINLSVCINNTEIYTF